MDADSDVGMVLIKENRTIDSEFSWGVWVTQDSIFLVLCCVCNQEANTERNSGSLGGKPELQYVDSALTYFVFFIPCTIKYYI